MIITRKSPMTGALNARDLPITDEQVRRYYDGEFAQDAFPDLSVEDREFLITGMTEADWARLEGSGLP